jgi:hypothetical protein
MVYTPVVRATRSRHFLEVIALIEANQARTRTSRQWRRSGDTLRYIEVDMTRSFVAALSLTCCCSFTSSASAQDRDPFWIDVNIGPAHAQADVQSDTTEFEFESRVIRFNVEYRRPIGGSFDLGGGYMLRSRFGVGVSLVGTAHFAEANTEIVVPNPVAAGPPATARRPTERELDWGVAALNLQGMVRLTPSPSRFLVRVFAGPTYFQAEQERVSGFSFEQSFGPQYSIEVTQNRYGTVSGTGWGIHVGGDASYFFNRHVGLGGVVRVANGKVKMADPVAESWDAGGFQYGVGLRLKF